MVTGTNFSSTDTLYLGSAELRGYQLPDSDYHDLQQSDESDCKYHGFDDSSAGTLLGLRQDQRWRLFRVEVFDGGNLSSQA